jgi:hypothetical protein
MIYYCRGNNVPTSSTDFYTLFSLNDFVVVDRRVNACVV